MKKIKKKSVPKKKLSLGQLMVLSLNMHSKEEKQKEKK
jgi:hypothetical protein